MPRSTSMTPWRRRPSSQGGSASGPCLAFTQARSAWSWRRHRYGSQCCHQQQTTCTGAGQQWPGTSGAMTCPDCMWPQAQQKQAAATARRDNLLQRQLQKAYNPITGQEYSAAAQGCAAAQWCRRTAAACCQRAHLLHTCTGMLTRCTPPSLRAPAAGKLQPTLGRTASHACGRRPPSHVPQQQASRLLPGTRP